MAATGDTFRCGVIAGGIHPVIVRPELFHFGSIRQVVLTSELVRTAAECSSVTLHRDPEHFAPQDDFTSLLGIGRIPDTNSIISSAGSHQCSVWQKAHTKYWLTMAI